MCCGVYKNAELAKWVSFRLGWQEKRIFERELISKMLQV